MSNARNLARLLPDSSGKIALPSQVAGVLPDANAPSGSVIQVVTYPWTTGTTINADGEQVLISGDITVQANSKIVCLSNIAHYSGAGSAWFGAWQCAIYENGTLVCDGEHVGTITSEAQSHQIPTMYTSPAKAAGTYTYSTRGHRVTGGSHEFNRSPRMSTMILMEIAA